jgi:hypothetical protein
LLGVGEVPGLVKDRREGEFLDSPSAATRSARLDTCEPATGVPDAVVDEVEDTVFPKVGGVMEKEGDRVRSDESPSVVSPGSISIEGRGSSGSTSSPLGTLGECESLLVEGVVNRPELSGLFSLCMVEVWRDRVRVDESASAADCTTCIMG